MPEKRKKDPQFITDVGVFVWPRLGTPDTKYKPEGEYSLKLRQSMKQAEALTEKLDALYQEAIAAGREKFAALSPAARKKLKELTINPLFTPEYDEEENETGEVTFKFGMVASGVSKKTGKPWSRKPGVFDAKRKPIDGNKVWGGTVGKVAFTVFPYVNAAAGACGLSLKLEAVQVLELVSGGERTGASYGFGEEDGYEGAADEPAETEEETEGESGDGDF